MISDAYQKHLKEINIKNRVYNYYRNLVKTDDLKTENIMSDEKSHKDLIISFVSYILKKSIKILSPHFQELVGKVKKYNAEKYLMVTDSVSNKIEKVVGTEFGKNKILIDTDDKFPNDIFLKEVFIILTCIIKDDCNYYPQMLLEQTLHGK